MAGTGEVIHYDEGFGGDNITAEDIKAALSGGSAELVLEKTLEARPLRDESHWTQQELEMGC